MAVSYKKVWKFYRRKVVRAMKNKKLQIRNSTAEFLTFTAETGEKSIEVLYAEENVWATQEMMTILYFP